MGETLLRLENLSIDYKVKDGYLSAVKNVNFEINRGEVFAVVGESGCGKSTVAHSIMNLLPGGNEEIAPVQRKRYGKDQRERDRHDIPESFGLAESCIYSGRPGGRSHLAGQGR